MAFLNLLIHFPVSLLNVLSRALKRAIKNKIEAGSTVFLKLHPAALDPARSGLPPVTFSPENVCFSRSSPMPGGLWGSTPELGSRLQTENKGHPKQNGKSGK